MRVTSDLRMKDSLDVFYKIFIVGNFVLIGLLFLTDRVTESKVENYYEETVHIFREKAPFSEELLLEYLEEINIGYPEVVFAQAKLESGNFSSVIFKENHNLFGMKKSYQRPNTCIGVNRNHAEYTNWKMSVLDYAIYQAKYLSRVRSQDEYIKVICASYAEDPNYEQKIRKIVSEL